MERYSLVLDCGATSLRAVAVSEKGEDCAFLLSLTLLLLRKGKRLINLGCGRNLEKVYFSCSAGY